MLKLLAVDQDYFKNEPVVTLLNLDQKQGMTKSAADLRISDFVSGIKPEPGKIYVHILAMGAGEFYGANRNGDYFPEENLKQHYQSFVTSPAHIFKHHINKDPTIAIGQVVFALYNERMHRVEVIAWIDREKGYDVVDKIERGEFPNTSMACHTPHDTCSICGNKARSRGEYCTHLRNELGKVYPDGRKVMSINDALLRFFDMSVVFRPADITSSVLMKVANDLGVMGSAEAAELHSIQEKQASLKKLSELIKELEGNVVASSPQLQTLLDKIRDPDHDVIDLLIGFDLHHVLHALAELGISPSIDFFAKLIGKKLAGSSVDGIETLVKGLIREESNNLSIPTEAPKSELYNSPLITSVLSPFVKQASVFPQEVFGRAVAPVGNVGYFGNGPKVEEDPQQKAREADAEARQLYLKVKAESDAGILKTLFMIGGAAVAAKWLLTKMLEEKMHVHRTDPNSQTKIVLVKSAEEAVLTSNFAKAILLKDLTG